MEQYQNARKQQEELLRQQEEKLNQLRNEARKQFEPIIKGIIDKGKQLTATDQRIKTLEQDLRDARASYAQQLTDIKVYYSDVLKQIPMPEYQQLIDKEIEEQSPELYNILHEDTLRTLKKVTKYLNRQAQFIDPVSGKTFATWQEASDYYHLNTHNDSAHRVFERERGYPLLELTNTTATAVNDCINTPGCVETVIPQFVDEVKEKKIAVDDSNALLDHIFEFLKRESE